MKKLLSLAAILLIFEISILPLYQNSVIYYYYENQKITTLNVIKANEYNDSYYGTLLFHHNILLSYYVYSSSYVSSSNNITINATLDYSVLGYFFNIPPTANINASTINVYQNGNLIIIPILVYYTGINNSSVYNYVNITLSEGKNHTIIPLESNGIILNNAYHVPITKGLITLNVSWEINSFYLSISPIYYEELLVAFNEGGVYYVYFWNINITSLSIINI
ncbi:hypothetical protein [Acidianus manzaensis]|uniref:Uncharacterized protein n=1 Tax=Acidianus manzaensis TaxID=282676 RepID=A0A1W6K346_9CREN|nr:hypothetical protein [Acidianus manzaensis]ARM76872.1 hypothetical protein B6F84_13140 [Acidianus manzaensis]